MNESFFRRGSGLIFYFGNTFINKVFSSRQLKKRNAVQGTTAFPRRRSHEDSIDLNFLKFPGSF